MTLDATKTNGTSEDQGTSILLKTNSVFAKPIFVSFVSYLRTRNLGAAAVSMAYYVHECRKGDRGGMRTNARHDGERTSVSEQIITMRSVGRSVCGRNKRDSIIRQGGREGGASSSSPCDKTNSCCAAFDLAFRTLKIKAGCFPPALFLFSIHCETFLD